ncbi:5-hydroxytryptamine receptor 1B-like [Paramacrobiotus metropolitanus]|uniref:5-hydroxytryptamine receptor 1B-like n=1 Tax=Paramacrobiotus metropolitanus TaxID=2943436 RepID=UPI002445EE0B|nr:5-hydroxytryptamine receptor 1B-like [Paramacrobiotus metropolitanus]
MYHFNDTTFPNTTTNHSLSWAAQDSTYVTLRRSATGWTPLVTLKLLISIFSVLLNAAVLLVHYYIPAYINHFSVYLLALFLSNLFYILTSRPMGILDELYGIYPAAGYPVCVVYLYNKVSSVMPVLFHVLISLNRVWAVTFPISYRERHTKRLAVYICLGAIVYVHVLNFPPFLVDSLLYYPAVYAKYQDCGHISTKSLDFNKADEVLNRILPMVVVMVAYVFIIVKRWKKRHANRSVQVSITKSTPATNPSPQDGATKQNPPTAVVQPARPIKSVRPFVILTLTSISVVVCWAPAQTFFFIGLFLHISLPGVVFTTVSLLYSLQMIFDPLMWIFSLSSAK